MMQHHFTSDSHAFSFLPPLAVRDVHSLVIRSVCHAHGGVYKSVISNKIGKATCYAHLYVTGNFSLFACTLREKNCGQYSQYNRSMPSETAWSSKSVFRHSTRPS